MGSGNSQQMMALRKIEGMLSAEYKGDLEQDIEECAKLGEDLRTFNEITMPKIEVAQLSRLTAVLTSLISYVHKYASKMNVVYSELKDKEPSDLEVGIKGRIILLEKLFQVAIRNSIPLADYLWNCDESTGKIIPPIIKLAEGLYVLLYVHDLSTHFNKEMPPPAPLDTDLRLMWSLPETKYELYTEQYKSMFAMRYAIVSIIIDLHFYSFNEQRSKNSFLYLISSKIWKNAGAVMHSFLSLAFDFTYENKCIERQKELLDLRIILLDYLLLCMNNEGGDLGGNVEDKKEQMVAQYLETKNSQIQAKFGVANALDSSSSFTLLYMKQLAEERTKIITLSLANSFCIYLNDILTEHSSDDFSKDYHELLFRECVFYLQLILLNDTWNATALTQSLLEIVAGLSTIASRAPKDCEIPYATLCFLLIAIISKNRDVCVGMNKQVVEEYAKYAIKGFAGSYMDYFVFCVEKLMVDGKPTVRPFDTLIGIAFYNMLPYTFQIQAVACKKLLEIMVKLSAEAQEQKHCLQSLALICHGIKQNILCNLDDSIRLLGSLLVDPAFDLFLTMMEISDQDPFPIEKLNTKVSESESAARLSKAMHEKTAIAIKITQDASTLNVEINLANEKDVTTKDLILEEDHTNAKLLANILKESLLPNYKKWKAIKAPNSNDHDLKTMCEYLWNKSLVGTLELGRPVTIISTCGRNMLAWIKEVTIDIIIKSRLFK